MIRIATVIVAGAALVSAPAAAQNQGQGSGGGGGGRMGSAMPSGAPGNTPAPGNAGQLEHMQETEKFAFDRSGNSKAARFEAKVEAFLAASEDTRAEVMALGRSAQAGQPVEASAKDIRDALEADLQDWRKTFDIPRKGFNSIHEQLVPGEQDLTPAEWAVRRAQWFQARDKWIDDQRKSLGIPTG